MSSWARSTCWSSRSNCKQLAVAFVRPLSLISVAKVPLRAGFRRAHPLGWWRPASGAWHCEASSYRMVDIAAMAVQFCLASGRVLFESDLDSGSKGLGTRLELLERALKPLKGICALDLGLLRCGKLNRESIGLGSLRRLSGSGCEALATPWCWRLGVTMWWCMAWCGRTASCWRWRRA